MNTKINYLYRDASNYKVWNECVIQGPITDLQIEKIRECLMDGAFFKPDMVGLPGQTFADLGYDPYPDDPEFFELGDEGDMEGVFEDTEDARSVDLTADQLVQNFIEASKKNWI